MQESEILGKAGRPNETFYTPDGFGFQIRAYKPQLVLADYIGRLPTSAGFVTMEEDKPHAIICKLPMQSRARSKVWGGIEAAIADVGGHTAHGFVEVAGDSGDVFHVFAAGTRTDQAKQAAYLSWLEEVRRLPKRKAIGMAVVIEGYDERYHGCLDVRVGQLHLTAEIGDYLGKTPIDDIKKLRIPFLTVTEAAILGGAVLPRLWWKS